MGSKCGDAGEVGVYISNRGMGVSMEFCTAKCGMGVGDWWIGARGDICGDEEVCTSKRRVGCGCGPFLDTASEWSICGVDARRAFNCGSDVVDDEFDACWLEAEETVCAADAAFVGSELFWLFDVDVAGGAEILRAVIRALQTRFCVPTDTIDPPTIPKV